MLDTCNLLHTCI